MNFYEFKYGGGEIDWVFAPDMKEAKEFYINHTGCVDLDDCTVTRLKKAAWATTYILDIEEFEPDGGEHDESLYCHGYKIEMSFKEYAEKNKFIDLVATTEF